MLFKNVMQVVVRNASRMIGQFFGDHSITTLIVLIACDYYRGQYIVFVHDIC